MAVSAKQHDQVLLTHLQIPAQPTERREAVMGAAIVRERVKLQAAATPALGAATTQQSYEPCSQFASCERSRARVAS